MMLVNDLVRHDYGDREGEVFVEALVDLMSEYFKVDFPESLAEELKEALIFEPETPKNYFERILKKPWPPNVPELPFENPLSEESETSES